MFAYYIHIVCVLFTDVVFVIYITVHTRFLKIGLFGNDWHFLEMYYCLTELWNYSLLTHRDSEPSAENCTFSWRAMLEGRDKGATAAAADRIHQTCIWSARSSWFQGISFAVSYKGTAIICVHCWTVLCLLYGLFNNETSSTDCCHITWQDEYCVMNFTGCERKWWWPCLWYKPRIYLWELRKSKENLSGLLVSMLKFDSGTSKTQQKNCNLLHHDFWFLYCTYISF